MKIPDRSKGFTLIELLIVIGIIGLLAGILLPVLSRAKESARSTQCASNIRQIGMGLIMYANENGEAFPQDTTTVVERPAMRSLNLLFNTYVSDSKIFKCPSDATVTNSTTAGMSISTANDSFDQVECSYGYDYTHTQADDAGVALISDRPPTNPSAIANSPNHNGRGQNVVYIDGHVEFVNSPLAGWYEADGVARDNVFLNAAGEAAVSSGGSDTSIIHDGL
ncbi:MAG: type II secretion system protein [Candidatus Brocadiaceae bacterium]|nr:type II secretion system protein [Candidatus Brocadiaceae bacterium]